MTEKDFDKYLLPWCKYLEQEEGEILDERQCYINGRNYDIGGIIATKLFDMGYGPDSENEKGESRFSGYEGGRLVPVDPNDGEIINNDDMKEFLNRTYNKCLVDEIINNIYTRNHDT